eukprot:scaffold17_cov354-Pavlova_lutheri.AAC.31
MHTRGREPTWTSERPKDGRGEDTPWRRRDSLQSERRWERGTQSMRRSNGDVDAEGRGAR